MDKKIFRKKEDITGECCNQYYKIANISVLWGTKMAKRKKNESIAEFRKRASSEEIMDTSAGEMMLDLNAKDPDVNENGIIEQRLKNYRINDIVFSMRMDQDLLKHIKQIAREKSAELKINIPYQMLISEAVVEKYPIREE